MSYPSINVTCTCGKPCMQSSMQKYQFLCLNKDCKVFHFKLDVNTWRSD